MDISQVYINDYPIIRAKFIDYTLSKRTFCI